MSSPSFVEASSLRPNGARTVGRPSGDRGPSGSAIPRSRASPPPYRSRATSKFIGPTATARSPRTSTPVPIRRSPLPALRRGRRAAR